MELNIVKTTYADLPSAARCLLGLSGKPFCFIRLSGALYMNKSMKGGRKVMNAISTLWKYDFMETQEIMDEVDAAFDVVKQAAGARAADQLWSAWHDAAKESREKRSVKQARAFILETMENLTDEDWDEMAAAGYDSTFVDTGLWRAYSDLHDENRDRPGYKDWGRNARTAAFVYGYILGKKAKEASA